MAEADNKEEEEETPFVIRSVTDDSVSPYKCRYYEDKYPKVDQLVMVNVVNVETLGAYVQLLEYDDIEGMVLLSELSRRRIRSINKLIRVNRKEVVMVLRVDREKGYVDLSKRRVPAEDVQAFTSKYNKAKHVHSILFNVAKTLGFMLEDLYTAIGWPLYKRFGHAYDAFKAAIVKEEEVFKGIEMPPQVKKELMKNIRRRLAAQPIKIRADIEVTCFTKEGIDAIREGLLAGKATSVDEIVSIKLIAPPRYVLTVTHLEEKVGVAILSKAITKIGEVMKAKCGRMAVKVAPHATSQQEDRDLQSTMQTLAKANMEVAGDDE